MSPPSHQAGALQAFKEKDAMPRRLWLIIGLLALLLAMAGLWQWLAMGDVLTPRNLRQLLASTLVLRETFWAPLALMALYVPHATAESQPARRVARQVPHRSVQVHWHGVQTMARPAGLPVT